MTFDALSFVLGALAVTIVVVAWCWVRRASVPRCDVARLARRVHKELEGRRQEDPLTGAAIWRVLCMCKAAMEEHAVDWADEYAQGFQPRTQADEPRLPDGSEPVSGVQDPMATCPRCGLSVHMWDGRGCRCIIGDHPKVPPAPPLAPSATRSTIGRADRPKPQGNVLRKETER